MAELLNERLRLAAVDPYKCRHPILIALWKFRYVDDIIYRCMLCGKTITVSESEATN